MVGCVEGRARKGGESTAADGNHDFKLVAIGHADVGMLALRHDLAVAIHRHPLARQPEGVEQFSKGERLGKRVRLAVDE